MLIWESFGPETLEDILWSAANEEELFASPSSD